VQHCDDGVLALVALGDRPSAADAEHLRGCAECRSEIDSFGRVVAAARPPVAAGPDVPPPPRVWDAVAAATGVEAGPAFAPSAARGVVPLRSRAVHRGRRGWVPMVAVAAAALIVGAVLGVAGDRFLPGRTPVQVVARTTLRPLPLDPTASGSASVLASAGARRLEVDVSQLTRVDGFYEVWLIDRTVHKMVPIGILTGRRGDFSIPAGLDLGQYPLVDISAEPLDGNPAHSGKSLLRGTIAT
jgi:Anti-sigma-K factor rskA